MKNLNVKYSVGMEVSTNAPKNKEWDFWHEFRLKIDN